MNYKIVIEPRAIVDIQDAVDYYDFKKEGLGLQFYSALVDAIKYLESNPHYQIRYKDYHALPLRKFPYIVLFYIDENDKEVYIMSVFNTFLNPLKYPK